MLLSPAATQHFVGVALRCGVSYGKDVIGCLTPEAGSVHGVDAQELLFDCGVQRAAALFGGADASGCHGATGGEASESVGDA
jgi:hypothetical protein